MQKISNTHNNYAIKVDHVSKTFKLPHERVDSVKSALINFARRKKGYEIQHVLNDISFEIKKGEFFGIVGRNGSGKSTLLKILAGIYVPTKGAVYIEGKLTPFIELGVGFNAELTGRENVFLNGALLGFNRKEMRALYGDIVEFAELGRFMDQKLKNYSSGMQVRLAFSIAIRANTPILLLDEVLAVGDADFQRKCYDYFMSLKHQKRTVILVTHDMGAVRQYCDRAIMIEKSKIIKSGTAEEVAQEYQKLFVDTTQAPVSTNDDVWGEGGIKVGKPRVEITDALIRVITPYKVTKDLPAPIYGFVLYNRSGTNVLEANTLKEKIHTQKVTNGARVTLKWEFPNILPDGSYSLSVACCDRSTTHFYQWVNNALVFNVRKYNKTAGVVDPEITVTIDGDT